MWINRVILNKGLRKFMVNNWLACAWPRFKPATHLFVRIYCINGRKHMLYFVNELYMFVNYCLVLLRTLNQHLKPYEVILKKIQHNFLLPLHKKFIDSAG